MDTVTCPHCTKQLAVQPIGGHDSGPIGLRYFRAEPHKCSETGSVRLQVSIECSTEDPQPEPEPAEAEEA